MQTTPSAAAEYVAAGFALVPLTKDKRPAREGWQQRERTVTTIEEAVTLTGNIGLAHAYSGTACIDIDDYDVAEAWFRQHGIELAELMGQPDAVMISSGRAGRAKILYRLPASVGGPLRTRKPVPGLELRCGTRNGLTVQDVLPPSLHPITQRPYVWAGGGDWRNLRNIPTEVLAAWLEPEERTVSEEAAAKAEPVGLSDEALTLLLSKRDPDIGYDAWVKTGMALHHETSGEPRGLDLWDQWSAQGDKYVGRDDLTGHWDSFGHGDGPAVTARSLMGNGASAASPDEFDVIVESIEAEAVEAKQQPGASLIPVADFAGREPMRWLIKGVLPRGEISMIYGESTAGKSFIALDMACAIVRGVEWNGHKVRAPGRVAYIAAEGLAGFQTRCLAYGIHHDVKLSDMPGLLIFDGPGINLRENGHRVLAKAVKEAGGVDLIIIDTLARATPGANENTSEDMGKALDHCGKLNRATGATVLLVHHAGKNLASGARGWSGIKGTVDSEILVARDREQDTRTVSVPKQKDGRELEGYQFELVDVETQLTDEWGEPIGSCAVRYVPASEVRAAREPNSPRQRLALRIVRETCDLAAGPVPLGTVLAGMARQSADESAAEALNKGRTALGALVDGGYIELADGMVRPL